MNVSVKALPPLFIAKKNNRFPQTQSHRGFSVLPVTFFLPGTVHKDLRAFDHQAFDDSLVLMTFCCTQGRIEIAQMETPQSRIAENLIAVSSHFSKVIPRTHASCDINVHVVNHRKITLCVLQCSISSDEKLLRYP